MAIRVGLMGFGRIGRNLFRILHQCDEIEIVAISDIADHASLVYLLRYDTILGRFPDEVSLKGDSLFCDGKQVKMLSGRNPGDVNWGEHDVDVVIEATSRNRTRDEVIKHLEMGAKKVLLCVPTESPDNTIIMGVNEEELSTEDDLISCGSNTAHCTLPIIQMVDKAFGIDSMHFTSVHAYTNDQRLADVPTDDLRRGRAATENIIPTETNTAGLICKIIPHLEGKVYGAALNVPVPNGSLVDMTFFTQKPITVDSINEVIRTGIDSRYDGVVEYVDDPIVSSDVQHSAYSSTYDSLATTTLGDNLVKTIAWFDNGWGYSHRVIDLIDFLDQRGDLS